MPSWPAASATTALLSACGEPDWVAATAAPPPAIASNATAPAAAARWCLRREIMLPPSEGLPAMRRSQPTGTKPALRHRCDFAESRFGGRCRPYSQVHHRAAAVGRLGPDLPAVRLRHLADDRQAETRPRHPARGLGAVEAVEDVRKVLRVDSRPVVAH